MAAPFDPRNPSGEDRNKPANTTTITPPVVNAPPVHKPFDPRNPSGRTDGQPIFDPRNPSGEKKEMPRRTIPEAEEGLGAAAAVSNLFDPRNPSGQTKVAPPTPRLVNDNRITKDMDPVFNLFINYYIDNNIERQKELVKCVVENCKHFDNIFVIADFDSFEDIQALANFELTPIITTGKRATYLDYFDLISVCNAPNNINVIANLDIMIPRETLVNSIPYFMDSDAKRVLALTRWDMTADGSSEFFNRADSQDVWIFNGAVEKGVKANFHLGMPGCDNALAHRLDIAGYEVINPSLNLKTYHQHLVPVRNYLNNKGEQKQRGVSPPYKILQPTE